MSSPDQAGGRGLSDGELLARWLDEANDDAGVSSWAVFNRHRDAVRSELERMGLAPLHAVREVSSVFHKAREERADLAHLPLRERLTTVAREVAELSIKRRDE
jgi:hypothetical protein